MFLALIMVSALVSTPRVLAQAGYDLMRAAFSGDLQRLRAILEAGTDVNMRDSSESTPLMLAASKGHIEVVRELLAKGANIDLQNSYGWTPLMLATTNRHTEIVSLLLTPNTDANIANQQRDAPILPPKNTESSELIAKVNETPASGRVQNTADNIPTQEDTIRAEIAELLETAERHIDSLRLTKPAKDNAYTTFLRVLELDPQNRQAKDGLQRIATLYEKRARQYLADGAIQSSLTNVKRGLRIMPDHHGLLAVQSDANTLLKAKKVHVAPAQKDLRDKMANQIEKKQDAGYAENLLQRKFLMHHGLLAVQSDANFTLLKAKKVQRQRVAPAQKDLRDKMAALNQIEKKQDKEEQAMRQSMQNLLQRKFIAKEN